MAEPVRVAVIGAGAFGKNHIRVYRELAAQSAVALSAIADPSGEALDSANTAATTQRFHSAGALLSAIQAGDIQLDAVSLCVPTHAHADLAIAFLSAGVHVLVEKPIASTLAEADAMIAAASATKRILQVGHLERFNPAVQEVARHLSQPMFFEVHRLSIFTPRSLDVDVVLDLMIHDLDIVLQFAKSPIAEIRAVGLPVLSDKTDIANVRIEFQSGCVANFTASRVSTERVRKLRCFQPHQYISLDYAKQEAFQIEVTSEASASAPSPELDFRKYGVTSAEPLRLEIESFLHSVATSSVPVVTAQQARHALQAAILIADQIAEHRKRANI